ncbi:hypothetical protein ACHAPU_003744 [Fusarium lateritium]
MPPRPGCYSFYSVPSDLGSGWEHIQQRDSEFSDLRYGVIAGSLRPNTELEVSCHLQDLKQHDPIARLKTVLLRSDEKRAAMRSES